MNRRWRIAGLLFVLVSLLVIVVFVTHDDMSTWNGARRVPLPPSLSLREPVWAPSGDYIAVVRDDQPPDTRGTMIIVGIGTDFEFQTQDRCRYFQPNWSPDGAHLIYTSCRGIEAVSFPNMEPFIQVEGQRAIWSPDGQAIAVFEHGNYSPSTLGVRTLVSTDLSVVFSDTAKHNSYGGMDWASASDSLVLSFGANGHDPTAAFYRDLYVFSPGFSEYYRLAETSNVNEIDPSWSPDGYWLAYVSSEGYWPTAQGAITFMRSDGMCELNGYSHKGLTGVDWSPDGASLAVTVRNQLYIVDIATMLGRPFNELDMLCTAP